MYKIQLNIYSAQHRSRIRLQYLHSLQRGHLVSVADAIIGRVLLFSQAPLVACRCVIQGLLNAKLLSSVTSLFFAPSVRVGADSQQTQASSHVEEVCPLDNCALADILWGDDEAFTGCWHQVFASVTLQSSQQLLSELLSLPVAEQPFLRRLELTSLYDKAARVSKGAGLLPAVFHGLGR